MCHCWFLQLLVRSGEERRRSASWRKWVLFCKLDQIRSDQISEQLTDRKNNKNKRTNCKEEEHPHTHIIIIIINIIPEVMWLQRYRWLRRRGGLVLVLLLLLLLLQIQKKKKESNKHEMAWALQRESEPVHIFARSRRPGTTKTFSPVLREWHPHQTQVHAPITHPHPHSLSLSLRHTKNLERFFLFLM
jgi:hypothetical protein